MKYRASLQNYVNRVELDTDEVRALKDHPGITPVDFTDGPYYNFTRSQIIAPGVRMIPAACLC